MVKNHSSGPTMLTRDPILEEEVEVEIEAVQEIVEEEVEVEDLMNKEIVIKREMVPNRDKTRENNLMKTLGNGDTGRRRDLFLKKLLLL